jgi:DNA polymerase III subunit delta'
MLLSQAVTRDRVAPAYLFAGAAGIGKRLAAQAYLELLLAPRQGSDPLLAKRISERNHPDLLWVEPTYLEKGKRLTATEAEAAGVKKRAAPIVRLDQIREVTQFLSRPPMNAARSVVVIEQADTMAEPAANALLKTLEEPGQATLILTVPSLETLLPTLVSRCQRIPFKRLALAELTAVLRRSGHSEILDHPAILTLAQGSPGAAIEHWQQIQALPPELLAALQTPPASLRSALTLAKQIAKGLDSETQLWLLDYLQQEYFNAGATTALLLRLEQAKSMLKSYVQPQLVWEVTLMQGL